METNKVEPIIIKGNIKLILTELKVNVLCPGTLLGEDEEFSLICRMYEKSTGIKEFEKTKILIRVSCTTNGWCGEEDWSVGIEPLLPPKTSNRIGEYIAIRDNCRFPSYLPLELFDGKKEGDIVDIDSKWGKFQLRINRNIGGLPTQYFVGVLLQGMQ